jgi:NADH-quinone oxidoreductase subunit G
MKIHVWNEKVDEARKGQMEFLLINHPLDCPICDKAGECPLQDYSFNYGTVTSRYGEFKRTYPGMDRTPIGPHVVQNMNRCIHCTRCIRFTTEITGTAELGFFKRGASTEVGVFPGTPLDNWMSACVTDVCPTGALTTREFRFESRVWNLDSAESVCNGCDVGCNIFIGHRQGQIFRYRPRVNPEVNDHWLCDFGRFSYERYDTDRVVVPKVRNDDDYLGISTWSEALEAIGNAVRGAKKTAAIFSANMTNEEAWLAKELFVEKMGASAGVMVDAIEPIKMKSRTEWLLGTQAAPNYRGVSAALGSDNQQPTTDNVIDNLLTNGADGIDLLFVTDAAFSERTKDPAAVANLRKVPRRHVVGCESSAQRRRGCPHPIDDSCREGRDVHEFAGESPAHPSSLSAQRAGCDRPGALSPHRGDALRRRGRVPKLRADPRVRRRGNGGGAGVRRHARHRLG